MIVGTRARGQTRGREAWPWRERQAKASVKKGVKSRRARGKSIGRAPGALPVPFFTQPLCFILHSHPCT